MDIKYWHRISKESFNLRPLKRETGIKRRLIPSYNSESALIYFQSLDQVKFFSESFKILIKQNMDEIEEEIKKGNIEDENIILYLEKYNNILH